MEQQGLSLPTADEWAYLCGGGCRTLFPWGDGMDYSMHLHHFESEEDQGKSYDMEESNFFGLSIAYDPYKREVVKADAFTTLRRRRRLQHLRRTWNFSRLPALFPSLQAGSAGGQGIERRL